MENNIRVPGFVSLCHMRNRIIEPGYCRMTCDPRPELMNSAGYYHGGVIFSLIDSAAGRAACCYPEGYRRVVTQSASVYYLRPCKESVLRAEANCAYRGRQTATVTVEIFDERDRLIAKGEVSCFYVEGMSANTPYRDEGGEPDA